MIGTWLGHYKYDNVNHQKAIGYDKTFFTITINSFDEKGFNGTVVDDIKSGGMEGKGKIIGEIKGETITFKKFMPRELLLSQNGEHKYSDRKHPTLYYKGVFSKDKKEISGKWRFKIAIGFIFGFIPIPYRPGAGTWSMILQ